MILLEENWLKLCSISLSYACKYKPLQWKKKNPTFIPSKDNENPECKFQ